MKIDIGVSGFMPKHYLFIVNPRAGNGKAGKDWVKIEALLLKRDVQYKAVLTTRSGHAHKIVEEELQVGYKTFVVVGGDGTLNEVVNGVFQQTIVQPEQIQIGIIPVGTGNDWARNYKLPGRYKSALERIFSHQEHYQDVGRVRHVEDGKENISYFVNVSGFAFDSQVVNSTNKMQERGNRAAVAYLFNLLRILFSWKAQKLHVIANDTHIHRCIFSMSIGIGRYSGGGMLQTPDADLNDGLFDVSIYEDMSSWKILRNIYRLYNGSINKVDTVTSFRCDRLMVYNGKGMLAQLDGELVTGDKFEIEVLPSALRVLV
ncbi:MAG: diacylglycerol/lipid kinase family protein [Bacteroidota bacterium]